MSGNTQFFRASVGAVIRNAAGGVLVFERADHPGEWQLPQGGIQAGEEPEGAIRRELAEETGIPPDRVALEDVHPEWLAYELPRDYRSKRLGRGQVQRWFLFRLVGVDTDIDLHRAPAGEFTAWRWSSLACIAEEAALFRRGVYGRLVERWGP